MSLRPMPEIFTVVRPQLLPLQSGSSLLLDTAAKGGRAAVYTVTAGDEIALTARARPWKSGGSNLKLWWMVRCANESNALPS
eukprot:SAG31_NODE_2170_length_6266_cov_7.557646_3_plen_82_part_00